MKQSCTFIILGATGDLAVRKLIPAFYQLIVDKKISQFVCVGAALSDTTVDDILSSVQKHIDTIDESAWQQLRNSFEYQQLNFNDKDDFVRLNERLQEIERDYNISGDRMVYCATAAQFFCQITQYLADSGIIKHAKQIPDKSHSIVYEKPFGHDYESAHEINECIKRNFEEEQVFRVDHYLTKEVVGNIALMRFTNAVLEPLWNHNYIEHVQIELSESNTIGSRGRYYDKYGAIRDVVQNHMLEIMALIAMEAPVQLTGEFIRDARVQVLQSVEFADGIRGQYNGYLDEEYVPSASQTETFALLQFYVNTPRWRNVPFFIKTGKALHKRETVVHIRFKKTHCLLLKGCPTDANWLTIRISPEAVFSLTLNAKKPGYTDVLTPIEMSFCHSCTFGFRDSYAYEVLLQEVLRSAQSVSVRFDEIERAWRIVDAIIEQNLPLYHYEQGMHGPGEIHEFLEKHKAGWRV